jgi:L-asparaginase II
MNPAVLVEVTRGGFVESAHFGSAVIADRSGVRWSIGDVEAPIFPRSAVKPLQALPLIETGAADRFGLGDAEIALACASHSGEPRHTTLVSAWLSRIGLDERALACGMQWPTSQEASRELTVNRRTPTALHNNCSGKHSGFLSAAVASSESVQGYVDPNHPTQRRWRDTLSEFSGVDLVTAPIATDGCGIPTIALPLTALARAYAGFSDNTGFVPARQTAVARIQRAMRAEPFLVAGTNRLCTQIIQRTSGAVLAKVGAEGVYCAAIPDLGVGVALKISDGASRAAEAAVVAVVRLALGPSHAATAALADLCEQPIYTRAGKLIGAVHAVELRGN